MGVPAIASVNPNPTSVGGDVTITGTGFSNAASDFRVAFPTSSHTLARVTPSAAISTRLTVTTPANAVSGAIQVFRLDAPMASSTFPVTISNTPSRLQLSSVNPAFRLAVGSSVNAYPYISNDTFYRNVGNNNGGEFGVCNALAGVLQWAGRGLSTDTLVVKDNIFLENPIKATPFRPASVLPMALEFLIPRPLAFVFTRLTAPL